MWKAAERAICRKRIHGVKTYSSVIQENVKTLLLGIEGFYRRFNARQVREVEAEKLDAAIAIGRRFFESLQRLLGLGR